MSDDGGLARLGRIIAQISSAAPAAVDEATVVLGMACLARVKLNASGRPGPRRVTGDYTRTINMQADSGPDGVEVTIGTNAVQALRLEKGFYGQDSLGRMYRQPPFQHFEPAYVWTAEQVEGTIPGALSQVIGRIR